MNRAASILAGLVASAGLTLAVGAPAVPPSELTGAALVIVAIVVLAVPTALSGRRKALAHRLPILGRRAGATEEAEEAR